MACRSACSVTLGSPRAAVNRFQSWVIRSGSRGLPSTVPEHECLVEDSRPIPSANEFELRLAVLLGGRRRRKRARVMVRAVLCLRRFQPQPVRLSLLDGALDRSLPASRSRSPHCRPISSPRRMPVESNTTTCGKIGASAWRQGPTSPGRPRGSSSPSPATFGGETIEAGFLRSVRAGRRRQAPCANARWRGPTVCADSGRPSWPPAFEQGRVPCATWTGLSFCKGSAPKVRDNLVLDELAIALGGLRRQRDNASAVSIHELR